MIIDHYAILTDPKFLILCSIVAAGFLPMLYSIWTTWEESDTPVVIEREDES